MTWKEGAGEWKGSWIQFKLKGQKGNSETSDSRLFI